MTTLAANSPRIMEIGSINGLPVITADIIYEGSAIGDNGSGYAQPLVAGYPFRGFCQEKADNSSGANGAINVQAVDKGKAYLAVTSVAITDVGRPVYASDDAAFNLSGIGTKIGHVYRYVSSGYCIVAFDAKVPEWVAYLSIPIELSTIADGDIVTTFTPGFNGRIIDADFITTVVAPTASKVSTLNFEIGTTNVTGGTIALTTVACNTLGKIVAAAAITAGAAFKSSDTVSVEAASTTTFVEGAGVLVVKLGM